MTTTTYKPSSKLIYSPELTKHQLDVIGCMKIYSLELVVYGNGGSGHTMRFYTTDQSPVGSKTPYRVQLKTVEVLAKLGYLLAAA